MKNLFGKQKNFLFLLGIVMAISFLVGISYFYFPHGKTLSKSAEIEPIPTKREIATSSSEISKNSTLSAEKVTPTVEAEAKPAGFCLTVPVLMYHHVEPIEQAKTEGHAQLTVDANIFDGQMKYLSDHGYRSVSAEELANAVAGHTGLGKAVVVTLDDGYADAYNFAYPAARKYGIILNLMIPTGLMNNSGYLNWNQLKEMVNSGTVYAYDHTWSHYSLPHGDRKKEEMEILTAKTQLEQNLGKTVKIFAYPYGTSNQQVIDILQQNGFIAAFSTISSFYQCDSFIFSLHRNRIGNASLASYGL